MQTEAAYAHTEPVAPPKPLVDANELITASILEDMKQYLAAVTKDGRSDRGKAPRVSPRYVLIALRYITALEERIEEQKVSHGTQVAAQGRALADLKQTLEDVTSRC